MAGLRLKNISKNYEGYGVAVSDFNLEVKDGEVIALVGPSGCGKTTTLRMVAGLETISGGELYIGDTLSNNLEPKDRDIEMVFQNYAIFPHMNTYDNIAFGLFPCDLSEDEIRVKVEEVSRILDVTHLFERKPRELSSGQKQRAALARALISGKSIILLDEPLANLDEKLRFAMRTELIKLQKLCGRTFIYVTHHMNEAMAIADRIVIMHNGLIKQIDTPKNLYNKPANLFTAGFVGSPQMDFWNAVVSKCDDGIYISGEISSDWEKFRIKLNSFSDTGEKYIGKEVIAGIRPEYMYIDEENTAKYKEQIIELEISTIEFYGLITYIHFKNSYFNLTVNSSDEYNIKTGDRIKVALNPDKIFLFDKETENTINYRP